MKQKKIPMRQCCGCSEMKPKAELVRVVRTPEGEVCLDLTGRKNGRGAYICGNVDCFNAAVKRKAFLRAFGTNLTEDTIENILKEISFEE